MQQLLQHIDDFTKRLQANELQALSVAMPTRAYRKGDFLLKQGEICRKSFWIKQGVARKFYLHDGKEITTELLFKDDLALSMKSYTLEAPSEEYIQALTDMEVSVTTRSDFEQLKKQYPSLLELDLMLTEYYALWLENRLFDFHTLDATQRYQKLLREQPHIIQAVPLTFIASYLGISLETLSRIRAKILI